MSDTELKLDLADGSLWKKYPGALILKGINVGDGGVRMTPTTDEISFSTCCNCELCDANTEEVCEMIPINLLVVRNMCAILPFIHQVLINR